LKGQSTFDMWTAFTSLEDGHRPKQANSPIRLPEATVSRTSGFCAARGRTSDSTLRRRSEVGGTRIMLLSPESGGHVRVLVVHNQYRSELPSGENLVVVAEVEALRAAGVEVDTYFRFSDEIKYFRPLRRAALPIRPIYSSEDAEIIRRRIRETRPDVVHLHNPFPLISPYVIRVAKSEGVPVIQTVHNYRHSCPAGDFFRDGRVCEDCSGKAFPWPAVAHGCYRGSRPQSTVMATAARLHRATWLMVDHFLPVSEFVAKHLVLSGIPRERMSVRPNFTLSRGPVRSPGSGFLFVGRLTSEKGASLLVSAWAIADLWRTQRLVVAGAGPESELILKAKDRNVHYVGAVDQTRVSTLLDEAAVVVIPSLCYEGFPRLVAEAFERGRPVAATAIGSLAELITHDVGWTAPPEPLAFAKILSLAVSDSEIQKKGAAARAVYESKLTPLVTTAHLLDLYAALRARGSP
jgi:glycosyltransferase involved in cell wall biosynthesis